MAIVYDMRMTLPLSLANIEQAAQSIDARIRQTPQYVDPSLSRHFGTDVLIKIESANVLRSFKGRGADFFMKSVKSDQPVVTASAGNFGQAIAWAGATRGIEVRVFAAENANPRKIDRMRALGAQISIAGHDFDAAKDAAREFAERHRNARFVEDGRDPAISEGAGTIGYELAAENLDTLLVPVGNGALVSGVGTWLKAHSPKTRVIGVVAGSAPSMALSWEQGAQVCAPVSTIADGIAIRVPVPAALDWMKETVDLVVKVSESSILRALMLIRDLAGLLLEPAAAVGVAALMENPELRRGRVGTILTGSNFSTEIAAVLRDSPSVNSN